MSGLVLVAVAIVLQFVLVPLATRLPANTDVTVHYAGRGTLLNAEALKTSDQARERLLPERNVHDGKQERLRTLI